MLSVDIETFSSVELKKTGVFPYAESPDFEVLLIAYAWDDEPVSVVDLTAERMPAALAAALVDPMVVKCAFNAAFERACLSKLLGKQMPPEQWRCTAAQALAAGLPAGLDGAAKSLGIEQQKDAAGKALIRYFCQPCAPTKTNKGRTRNKPHHAPEKWDAFVEYCRQDVEVERAVRSQLEPLSSAEQAVWVIDQRINDRGVLVDAVLVEQAVRCDALGADRLVDEAIAITGLSNPNSVTQIKSWLKEAEGLEVESLNKAAYPTLLKQATTDAVRRVVEIRQELSKTSVTKYKAMERAACRDGRVRGLLQYYGAARTGRWAGRLVQVQNLPKNQMSDLGLARELVRGGDFEVLSMVYDSPPKVLSELIRTAFIPMNGCELVVCDYSAIEARVIAWVAGEQWRLDVFAGSGKIYEASAAAMFKVPIESIGKGSPLRQKGKVAELACGYGGGVRALQAMGADKMGLSESELKVLVDAWRAANPQIVSLWRELEDAAMWAVSERELVEVRRGVWLDGRDSRALRMVLPSGRRLSYYKPKIGLDHRFGREQLTYEGMDSGRVWGRIGTYGGKLTENLVQAIARDCLAEALLRLEDLGMRVVMHVHDEVVLEVPVGVTNAEEVADIISEPMSWAQDLPLAADGYECNYYRKD